MEPEVVAFARSYEAFTEAMTAAVEGERSGLTPVGEEIQAFLGVPLNEVEPVSESFPPYQTINVDLALESLLVEHGGTRRGVQGRDRGDADTIMDILTHAYVSFTAGPVSYERKATGPDTDRRVVSLGIAEITFRGAPLVWLQRTPQPRYGRGRYSLDVLSPDAQTADNFLAEVRERMAQLSLLRGQVISFAVHKFDFEDSGADLTFHPRPEVTADQVVLPEGVRERVTRHVVGIGQRRDVLLAAGQHLKRGVLLYGPPGTGKTHLVRHLLCASPGSTAVLLSGHTLHLMHDATTLARAAQPAIVVLEDCDLVAEHRGRGTNAALFETLEAMDGLAADADITFILTTNRVDLLERALVERPGRVDLAVEITKPDQEARERLFRLYAAELLEAGQLSDAAAHTAAARTEGVTASFTKELIRRVVINAAQQDRTPTDADVSQALDEMLSDAETLTRTLLGGEGRSLPETDDDEPEPGLAPSGWAAYPLG